MRVICLLILCQLLTAQSRCFPISEEKLEPFSASLVQKAEKGDLQSQYALGMYFFNGEDTKQNDFEAIKWLSKAAEGGHTKAQTVLGLIYESGAGVQKDPKKAFSWYLLAAEKGDSEGQRYLAGAYFSGDGVEKNYESAVYWYTKSAEQGDPYAQGLLGVCYAKGLGVAKNKNEARKWLEKSANQGSEDSKYFLEFQLNPQKENQDKGSSPIGETRELLEKRFGSPLINDETQQALQFEKGGFKILAVMRQGKAVLITIESNNGIRISEKDVGEVLKKYSNDSEWKKMQDSSENIIYKTKINELADYNRTTGALTISTLESMKKLKEEPMEAP